MKKVNILYWIFTGILAALMLMSAIPDVIVTKEAIDIVSGHLGYPQYIIPYLGIAKLLGAIALLIPRFPRLKEWIYAGFVFDLSGAIYSGLATGDSFMQWLPVIIIATALITCSYIYHHKRLRLRSA